MTPAHRILACPPTFFRPTLSPSTLNCSSVKSISNLHRIIAKGKSLSGGWCLGAKGKKSLGRSAAGGAYRCRMVRTSSKPTVP